MDDCQICAKHRGVGPLRGELVVRWRGLWVYHAPPGEDSLAPLGYLFIETDRHAPHLEDLSEDEAAAIGLLRSRLSRAMVRELDAENVFSAVIGRGIPHFHEHLFVRHRGTALDVPWHRSDEHAPRADEAAVADLARRLAGAIDLQADV
jgi:ATP adenylyltransferase